MVGDEKHPDRAGKPEFTPAIWMKVDPDQPI